jgi:hypothetical protein
MKLSQFINKVGSDKKKALRMMLTFISGETKVTEAKVYCIAGTYYVEGWYIFKD